MTADEYVGAILQKYAVPTGPSSPAAQAANAAAPAIRQWAGPWLDDLSLSGSYAKGTAVSTGTDVDLFISLAAQTAETLQAIYESLFRRSQELGWQPRRQNVSIRVKVNAISMDLVPGRLQQGYKNWHSLYRSKTASWTQTNVSLHTSAVLESGRTAEIRALKIWRDLHGIEFPSFYLELTVIDGLRGRSRNQLAANVMHALNYIATQLPTARVVDPANAANIVSDDLTARQKLLVAQAARQSASKPTWGEIIW